MHQFENVIWQALTTRQASFAETAGLARRFPREVTLLAAFEAPNDSGYQSLATLVGPGGTGAVFLNDPYKSRTGWEYVAGAPLLQMICENGGESKRSTSESPEIFELGNNDSREMVELATLTKPGPFGARTHELGY